MSDLGDDGPDIEKLRKLAALMPVKERLEKYRKIDRIVLHPKQREFIELGATRTERALLGSNQSGKSTIGAYELVHHMLGDYPLDWPGLRFERAINGWVIGPTAQQFVTCCRQSLSATSPTRTALFLLMPMTSDKGARQSRNRTACRMRLTRYA
jgi:Terminase large subunit, T4likevirus-type, N-terminal